MILVFQVTAAVSALAAEAATGRSRSAAGLGLASSGPAAWPGGVAPGPAGASGAAFTAVLAQHSEPAAGVPPSEVEAEPSGEAAPPGERERVAADEALRAFAASLVLDLPAGGWPGIAALSPEQGNALRALGVLGSLAPAPGTREPSPAAVPVGIEGSAAAPRPGQAPGLAPFAPASSSPSAVSPAPALATSSAQASIVGATAGAPGSSSLSRAEAARGAAPHGEGVHEGPLHGQAADGAPGAASVDGAAAPAGPALAPSIGPRAGRAARGPAAAGPATALPTPSGEAAPPPAERVEATFLTGRAFSSPSTGPGPERGAQVRTVIADPPRGSAPATATVASPMSPAPGGARGTAVLTGTLVTSATAPVISEEAAGPRTTPVSLVERDARLVEVTGANSSGAPHLRSPVGARLAAAPVATMAFGATRVPTAATNARAAVTAVTPTPTGNAPTVTTDGSSVTASDPTVTQSAGTVTATRADGAVLAEMTRPQPSASDEAARMSAATARVIAGAGSSRPGGASDSGAAVAAEQALPEPPADELDGTPPSQPAARERAPDGLAALRSISVGPSIAAEVAGAPVALEEVELERRAVVSGARPGRPTAALRSGDEADEGVFSVRPEQRTPHAAAGGPAARVAMAALDAAPRADEADALGARASEGGDDRAVAVAAPAQPAAAAEAEPSRAEPAVSARSVAEQIAERLRLIDRPGRHEISLELRPADLGTLHVAARLEGRQLTLEIHAELAQVRDLLQQALPQLRESLVQQGFAAERVTIHLGLDASARDFSGQHFGAPRHFTLDEMLPTAAPRPEAPVRRRQLGSGAFDFWV